MARSRNTNTLLNYVDFIKNTQVRLLELSGTGAGTDADSGGQANQVAFWSDSDTVTGSDDLKFNSGSQNLYSNTGHLTLSSSTGIVRVSGSLRLPSDTAANNPAIQFESITTGIREFSPGHLRISTSGGDRWRILSTQFRGDGGLSPVLINRSSTATVPTFCPNVSDITTGIGGVANTLSFIAQSFEALRLDSVGRLIASSGHMILSSSAGSQITISGTLQIESGSGDLLVNGGQVGIGTLSPDSALDVVGAEMNITRYNAGTPGPVWSWNHSRGAEGSESASLVGDRLALLRLRGRGASAFLVGAEVQSDIISNTGTVLRGDLQFKTTNAAGSRIVHQYIDTDGLIGMSMGSETPGGNLEVRGGAAGDPVLILSRSVGGAGRITFEAGNNDPRMTFQNTNGVGGGDVWSIGVDNTNSNFVIASGSSLGVAGKDVVVVDENGNIGMRTSAPEAGLHIVDNLMIGESVETDAADKAFRYTCGHFTASEEPAAVIMGNSTSTGNTVIIGGGSSLMNAANDITFRTATNPTTVTGTERMRIHDSGEIDLVVQPRLSLTVDDTSTASAALYDVFDEDNYGGAVTTIDNITETQITYTETDGRFTVDRTGTYQILCTLFLTVSTTSVIDISLNVDGVSVWSASPTVNPSVDPSERTICILKTLSAANYVNVTVDGASSNVTVDAGTTMNIYKVA